MKKIEHRKIVLYKGEDHSFAVCAYGESPYLDECLRSLVVQTVKSHIFIITSTPNPHIFSSAEKMVFPFMSIMVKKDWQATGISLTIMRKRLW